MLKIHYYYRVDVFVNVKLTYRTEFLAADFMKSINEAVADCLVLFHREEDRIILRD